MVFQKLLTENKLDIFLCTDYVYDTYRFGIYRSSISLNQPNFVSSGTIPSSQHSVVAIIRTQGIVYSSGSDPAVRTRQKVALREEARGVSGFLARSQGKVPGTMVQEEEQPPPLSVDRSWWPGAVV